MIRNMLGKGLSVSKNTRQLRIDRKTARKYANSDEVLASNQCVARKSRLDLYSDRIKELTEKYNLSFVRILEKVRKEGYEEGHTILKEYCASLGKDHKVQAVYRYKTNPEKQSQVVFDEFGHRVMDGRRIKPYVLQTSLCLIMVVTLLSSILLPFMLLRLRNTLMCP
jgi:transposase